MTRDECSVAHTTTQTWTTLTSITPFPEPQRPALRAHQLQKKTTLLQYLGVGTAKAMAVSGSQTQQHTATGTVPAVITSVT